jgi:hypothetical protein
MPLKKPSYWFSACWEGRVWEKRNLDLASGWSGVGLPATGPQGLVSILSLPVKLNSFHLCLPIALTSWDSWPCFPKHPLEPNNVPSGSLTELFKIPHLISLVDLPIFKMVISYSKLLVDQRVSFYPESLCRFSHVWTFGGCKLSPSCSPRSCGPCDMGWVFCGIATTRGLPQMEVVKECLGTPNWPGTGPWSWSFVG